MIKQIEDQDVVGYNDNSDHESQDSESEKVMWPFRYMLWLSILLFKQWKSKAILKDKQ